MYFKYLTFTNNLSKQEGSFVMRRIYRGFKPFIRGDVN